MNKREGSDIPALTGLRFVAAFYVFIFHVHITLPLTSNHYISKIFSQGAIGMSLFFILSGFILAYRYSEGHIPIKKYFINRFARIYPVYLAAALLTLPWLGISPDSLVNYVKIFILIFSNVFLIQAWFPQFFSFWNNGGSWSISVEAFFYAIFPLVFPSMLRMSLRIRALSVFFLYVLSILPGVTGLLFQETPFALYYAMPIFRLSEFLIGIFVFTFYRTISLGKFIFPMQIFSIIIFVSYLCFSSTKVTNYIGHNFIAIPFISFLIFSLSSCGGGFQKYYLQNLSFGLEK